MNTPPPVPKRRVVETTETTGPAARGAEFDAGDVAEYHKKRSATRDTIHICEVQTVTPKRVRVLYRLNGGRLRFATVNPNSLRWIAGGVYDGAGW